jgi:hypothetical protein
MKEGTMKLSRLALAMLLVLAASCKLASSKPEAQIVGKWKAASEDKTYEFKADKTVAMSSSMMGMSLVANGTYALDDPTHLKVDFNGAAAVVGTQTYALSFNGPDQMTMKNDLTKQVTVYRRVKEEK